VNQFRRWLLKRTLSRAGHLHARRAITDEHYAAISVDVVTRLSAGRQPVAYEHLEGKEFGWIDFPIHALQVLEPSAGSWPPRNIEKTLSGYGPFNHATVWLTKRLEQLPNLEKADHGFRWTSQATEILREARLRVTRFGGFAFSAEAWLGERSRFFPRLSSVAGKVLLALVSALFGYFLGRGSN